MVPSGPLLNLYNYIDSHVPRYIIITDILKLILKAQNIHTYFEQGEGIPNILSCLLDELERIDRRLGELPRHDNNMSRVSDDTTIMTQSS